MTDRQLTASLAGSAAASVRAPSIHNNQPWRWILHTDSLDLYADRSRQLTSIDPDGRLMLISCGGAIHQALVTLAADGFGAQVRLLPDADPDHVATLTPTPTPDTGPAPSGHHPATITAQGDVRPDPDAVAALVEAAAAEGTTMRVLDRDQVIALAGASSVTRKVRERIGFDESTVYCVLFGTSDTTEAWLRAGAALSAVWLEATRRGLAVFPSWTVVELPGSRRILRAILPSGSVAYLAIRITVAAPPVDTGVNLGARRSF